MPNKSASAVCKLGHDKPLGKKCRVCYNAYKKEWLARPENQDRLKVYNERLRPTRKKYSEEHAVERKAYMDKWHAEHRAEENAKALAAYYRSRADGTHDQSRVNESVKRHREKHGRAHLDASYYVRHRDEQQARIAAWKAANPERAKEIAYHGMRLRKDRIRATNADAGSHTRAEWKAILEANGNSCAECGVSGEVKKLEKDHIQPLSRGGTNLASNLQPLCRTCNGRKSNRITGSPALRSGVKESK